MKAILLAGGLGTRISEETSDKPKPMVTINGKPILWHLMNILSKQGISDFMIAAGYRGDVIKSWADNIDSPWNIKTVDTGLNTQTGGRISQCLDLISDERAFVTYGDGLANVNLKQLMKFHLSAGTLATVTAVRPPARFGVLHSENGVVTHFGEKNQADSGWINGGFFIINQKVRNYIHALDEPFEVGALPRLVSERELSAYHHPGFWQPMDTLRERNDLETLATLDVPPWLEGLPS
jgi:glucose-1-phosphate cytidylyltransferase